MARFSSQIFFIVLAAGSIAAFFFLSYKPAAEEISTLKAGIGIGRSKSTEAEIITELLKEKMASVGDLRKEVKLLKEAFLPAYEYSPLMEELRMLFSKYNFKDESIFLIGQEKRDWFDAAVLKVKLLGDFEDVYGFLLGIEELSYAVRIDMLDLKGAADVGKGKDQVGKDLVRAQMNLSAPLGSM